MPKFCQVRPLTAEETTTLERLAHSRTAAVREVERARCLGASAQGQHVPAIAAELGHRQTTVRTWIARFNAVGLAGWPTRRAPGGHRPTPLRRSGP